MDKLTAIQVFLGVAETGSFSQTAEKLELSAPMVSRYVGLMEEWLNARLFHRTTRKVSLTEAGEQAVRLCQQIVNLTAQMEEECQSEQGELTGILRLAASSSFGVSHLTTLIGQFQRQHPKLQIQLNLGDQTFNLVEQRIDLAIRITNNPEPSLVARKLTECRSVLVATPSYLQATSPILSPQDLTYHRCLAHSHLNRNEWQFSQQGETVTLSLQNQFSVNDALALHQAALDDQGVAMLPLYLVEQDLTEGKLVRVLSDWQLPTLQIYALYSSRHKLPKRVRLFLDFLAEQLANKMW